MSEYAAFVSDYHAHFLRNPNARLQKGVQERLGELVDPSLDFSERGAAEAAALLDRIDRVRSGAGLSCDDRLDLDLARLALEAEIHDSSYRFNGRSKLEQMPTAGSDIGDGIFLLFANDDRPVEERLADIVSKLGQVPDYLDALLDRLDGPVARWVTIDVDKVRGLGSLFDSVEAWAAETGFSDRQALAAARHRADTALERYVERLEALESVDSFAVGPEIAQKIIALRGIELSLDELRRMAEQFLQEVGTLIEELSEKLAKKYGLSPDADADAVHRFLCARYRLEAPGGDFSKVLTRYERELERVTRFITERDLFPVPDDQELRVLKTPAFMEPSIPAGAMMPPPPFRRGTRRSLVYLTLSEALLDEHTELGIPLMMIHEGIPGHHLQLAFAAAHPSTIRRHFEAMDQAEGWTTMLEDYMLDVGYLGKLVDEARFCAKRDISRIGARVAIDLYFMTGDKQFLDVGVGADLTSDDPFRVAGNLLASVTGFVPERVQAELNWYSQERGYPLSYLTGNRLVWQLKRDVERGRGGGLDADRAFFRAYLDAGNMPVSFVRRLFREQRLVG